MSETKIDPEQEVDEQIKKELDKLHDVLGFEGQQDEGFLHCYREELKDEECDKEADTYLKAYHMNNFYTRFPCREDRWKDSGLGRVYKERDEKFKQDCLDVAAEEGVDRNTIEGYVEDFLYGSSFGFTDRTRETYARVFWPIYKKLRLKGYSHLELTQ